MPDDMTRIVITMTAPPRDRHGRGDLGGQVRAQPAARTLSANRVGKWQALGRPRQDKPEQPVMQCSARLLAGCHLTLRSMPVSG
ncbi:hypothetical protein ACFPRL_06505 [Pseudoclavibacter helvolus]